MSLYLSLGHNSSAIVRTPGCVTTGYEEERINRIKSSSAFPGNAVMELIKHQPNFGKICYVTHWFDSLNKFQLPECKYVNQNVMELIKHLGLKMVTHDINFTHHDAHARAAQQFLESHHTENSINEKFWYIVADGFGNMQEVVSIYEAPFSGVAPILKERIYGYQNSLGLMYQFATAYVGMKENQDEYKFLGYESHIGQCINHINKYGRGSKSAIYNQLIESAEIMAQKLFDQPSEQNIDSSSLFNFDELQKTREYWYFVFDKIIDSVELEHKDSFYARTVIGFYIQHVLETYMKLIIDKYKMKNVCVSGGVFYNVKLNNVILNHISGYICVYPLAGDQGAALGFENGPIKDLTWGVRDFYHLRKLKYHADIMYSPSNKDNLNGIVDWIGEKKIINLVRKNMEFGPRALGNTSSLFLPLVGIVRTNNDINNRNEVMPCAPIMLKKNLDYFFESNEYGRVIGSLKYMIMTLKYKKDVPKEFYLGVMHQVPSLDSEPVYTGRPQVIDEDGLLSDILNEIDSRYSFKALVNTSFNYHGEPIVFDDFSIISTADKQKFTMFGEKLTKLIIDTE